MGGKGKRGTRDILKQLEEREKKIQDKINNPPKSNKSNDDQPISKRMREFMKLKEGVKNVKKQKQPQKNINDDFKDKDSLITNKSTKRDLRRIENDLIKRKVESQFATKYKVQIIRDEKTGEIKVKKDHEKLKKQKELLKAAKLRIQEEAKSKKATEKKEVVIAPDNVVFGEVNKQPPNLIKVKSKNVNINRKAWQKGNLLLNKLS